MGLVAKRIEHVLHSELPKVVINSVNPEYTSYKRLAEEVRLVGRAVWVAQAAVRRLRAEATPSATPRPQDRDVGRVREAARPGIPTCGR